ncbi:uncharacterized protein LOC113343478 [Papaver somniferum]|uniref:uncharacterized protein LOC113343478 n=1 Tax=Papaver somniferum TaxID=3469 RepID=UPI000E701B1B|nr:uncharacterized protein LOC113343478 [Papaver somniferum]
MDDSEDDNVVVAYKYIVQSAHNLYQPVPVQVASKELAHRDRVSADVRMMQDYFNFNYFYGNKKFHYRFGMYRPLFLRILSKNIEMDHEFEQRPDVAGIMGHSPHMKMIAVMKCLCKAVPPYSIEDYTEMGARTIYRNLKRFLDALMYGFNDRYMRRPLQDDTDRLLRENAAWGFPGMLGSIVCLHWQWTACPTYRAGQHYSVHKRA